MISDVSSHMRAIALGAILLAALTAGCVPSTRVSLHNRMLEAVTVTTCRGPQMIASGQTIELDSHGCAYLDEPQLRVVAASRSWEYRGFLGYASWLFEQDNRFVSRRFPIGYDVIAQLEPDGTILILEAGVPMPNLQPANALYIRPISKPSES